MPICFKRWLPCRCLIKITVCVIYYGVRNGWIANIMVFIVLPRIGSAIHAKRIWLFRWTIDIILGNICQIGNMILPCAVTEEGHVLGVGSGKAQQKECGCNDFFHNV